MKQTFSEAIKLHDTVLYNLEYHQRRVDKTQERFGGKYIELSEIFSGIPSSVRCGLFKCRILYSDDIENIEFIPYKLPVISSVAIIVDNDISYSYKSTDRSRLDSLREKAGSDEIIIVKNGLVTDGFATNLVFETEDGKFYTPDSYLLQGTKRSSLIDEGRIIERRVTVDDIKSYKRVRFINAMIDLEDNIGIDTAEISM